MYNQGGSVYLTVSARDSVTSIAEILDWCRGR